jgi:hypothetical protein
MLGAAIRPMDRQPLNWPKQPDNGEPLADMLRHLLHGKTFPLDGDGFRCSQAVKAGDFIGMRQTGKARACVLIWHPAMAALLGSLRFQVLTVNQLHHALYPLVLSGHLAPRAVTRRIEGLGTAWFYPFRLGD